MGVGGLYPRGAYNWGEGRLISGEAENASRNSLTENYFNTSLLTLHTEFLSIKDKFSLLQA